jgi:hypothetical protein
LKALTVNQLQFDAIGNNGNFPNSLSNFFFSFFRAFLSYVFMDAELKSPHTVQGVAEDASKHLDSTG